ncbi:MAG: type II CAAX endopeptidase family protein [Actinomycetota bacterium]|nr:type II CAAX endopeptidase family protein [Actinomycetota bacterium]
MVKAWTFVDFILIWLGGFVGTGVFFAIGLLFESNDIAFVLALAGQYIGNLGVLWLIKRRKEDGDLGFSIEAGDIFYIGIGLALQFVMALAFLPLTQWLFPDGQPPQDVAEILADADASMLIRLSLILAAVVLAPVTEEIVFRGVLLRTFEHRSKTFVMVATAAIFSAVHILGLDTDRLLASAVVVLPPIFILGLILAWVTLRTKRLGPAIFLHSGWNLLAAFVLLLPPEILEGAA